MKTFKVQRSRSKVRVGCFRCKDHSECGLALVVVLWILAFLGIVFTTFTFSMRTELAAASNFKQETEAYYLAEAGVYRAAAEIINADRDLPPDSKSYDAPNEHWHTNPDAYENVALGGGHYWVAVKDEESKIPLNGQITPQYDAMLRRLFTNSGVRDDKLLSTLVDSIQDWRDVDNLHRMSGAEDDYYLSLPGPYRAKNADFDAIDELLLIKGMASEILYGNIASPQRRAELGAQLPWERDLRPGEYLGVAQHLSLYSSGQVNINTASPEVLIALGLTPAETKCVLDRRTGEPFRGGDAMGQLTVLLTSASCAGLSGRDSQSQVRASLGSLVKATSSNFSVESAARMTGSRLTVRIAAILRNDGTPGRPKLSVRLWSLDPRQGGV